MNGVCCIFWLGQWSTTQNRNIPWIFSQPLKTTLLCSEKIVIFPEKLLLWWNWKDLGNRPPSPSLEMRTKISISKSLKLTLRVSMKTFVFILPREKALGPKFPTVQRLLRLTSLLVTSLWPEKRFVTRFQLKKRFSNGKVTERFWFQLDSTQKGWR